MQNLIGIDFSGNDKKWSQGCGSSNVWVATAVGHCHTIELATLQRVQKLPGRGSPFERLRALLIQQRGYAAIDAPFSIPLNYTEQIEAVWDFVAELPLESRPFPRGAALLGALDPALKPYGQKVYRETEKYWQRRGVNTRSTIWNGPRGGAPFAVACMTLLSRHTGDIWPMRMDGTKPGCVLVEAFPAAQLRQWQLPHEKYDGPSDGAQEVRSVILRHLMDRHGLIAGTELQASCVAFADALDAVICTYAAAAVANGRIANIPTQISSREGWIAVHA